MTPDVVALGAEVGGSAASGMTEAINAGVSAAVGLVGTAFTAITGNTVLCIFLGVSLVNAGISIFHHMKGAVR